MRMVQKICILIRRAIFFCWGWPSLTKEKMELIAAPYGYKVKIVNSLPYKIMGCEILGLCDYSEKVLFILEREPQVFWHELGHAVDHQEEKVWRLPANAKLKELGKGIIYLRSEILATVLGFLLAHQWRKEK